MLQLGKESLGRGSTSLISAQQKLFKTGLSEHLDMLLSLFHLWFKDMLYVQYDRHEHIVFIDQLDMLSQLAHTRSTSSGSPIWIWPQHAEKSAFQRQWPALSGAIFDRFGIRLGEGKVSSNHMQTVITSAGSLRRRGFRRSGVGLQGG